MNITAGIVTTTVVIGLAAPAAAQDPDWVRSLEQRIERVTEGVQRRLEAQAQTRDDVRRRRIQTQQRREEMQRRRQQLARERREAVRRGPGLTEQVTKTVRLGRQGAFELTSASGDIVITGGSGDDVRIDATKRVWNPIDAEARAMLQELQVQITERTGQVDVRTVLPEGRRNFSAAVDYTIAVPSGASVSVRSVSGDVRVTNVRGELRAETVSGNLVLSSLGQLRALKSVSGDIQIDGTEGSDFTMSTVNGAVTARNLKARTIDLTSVSGTVRFTDVDSERVNLSSLNGDIEYAGRLARGGRYELQSHSGDIRVMPTNPSGFEVEAATLSGDVRSDFALTLGGSLGSGRRGPRAARTIRGSFGDGGASLMLRSFNGDITIVRR
jgi:DUF4097 and DUF4098 domain-containing protein YvlB